MVSLQMKVQRLSGLRGTKDVTPKEDGFIKTLEYKAEQSKISTVPLSEILSESQLDWLSDLHYKHFG